MKEKTTTRIAGLFDLIICGRRSVEQDAGTEELSKEGSPTAEEILCKKMKLELESSPLMKIGLLQDYDGHSYLNLQSPMYDGNEFTIDDSICKEINHYNNNNNTGNAYFDDYNHYHYDTKQRMQQQNNGNNKKRDPNVKLMREGLSPGAIRLTASCLNVHDSKFTSSTAARNQQQQRSPRTGIQQFHRRDALLKQQQRNKSSMTKPKTYVPDIGPDEALRIRQKKKQYLEQQRRLNRKAVEAAAAAAASGTTSTSSTSTLTTSTCSHGKRQQQQTESRPPRQQQQHYRSPPETEIRRPVGNARERKNVPTHLLLENRPVEV